MKPTRKISNKLTAAQKELLRQEEEMKRRELELQQQLKQLPEKLRQKREKERQKQRMEVTTAARGEYLSRVMHQRIREDSSGSKKPRSLRIQQKQGKIKFLILCIIFLTLLITLLRVMPG